MKRKNIEDKNNSNLRFSLRLRDKTIKRELRDELRRQAKDRIHKMPDKLIAQAESKPAEKDLAEVLKMLMLKSESVVSAECFEKIIPEYDGKSIPVKQWFENFEKNAEAYELSAKQKYVHARNKMSDLAKLYLESEAISDYETLKLYVCTEFHRELDSAEVHKNLQTRKMRNNETFREYVLQMKKLAAVGKVEESAIIKYVIDGLGHNNEAKYLLYSSKSIKELYEKFDIVEKLNKQSVEHKNLNKSAKEQDSTRKTHCFNCGSTSHKRSECRANTKCFKCNQNGHISKNCPQLQKNVNFVIDQKRIKHIVLNGIKIESLIDTGADVTILKQKIYKRFEDAILQNSGSILRGLGNKKITPIGEFMGEVTVDGINSRQRFVVVPDSTIGYDALLGYDFLSKYRFTCDEGGFRFSTLRSAEENADHKELSIYNITETSNDIDAPPQYKGTILKMINNYRPEGQEKCPIQLKIVPEREITRFRHSPSRLPVPEAEAVRKQVEEWLEKGIVRKSSSCIASRVVVVRKKDGTPRVCVDFRQLNSMVLRDCFPVPEMEDVFAKLQKAKYFTVMDLENGFFHVPVEESSRKYTAFVIKEGLYEFNVAPFGFCNSPAAFIRFVSYIFQDLINENVMELYMDDIIVYAQTMAGCLEKMALVLQQATKFNLKIRWKKCRFLQTKIDFLGHRIEGGQIWPGEEKTKAVSGFKIPTNIKAVQAFLGLTGFFRKFIPGYAGIARPLTNLLKKNATFQMETAELNAIQQLKDALTQEPVLRIYERDALTEVHTDASKDGFGAALLQVFEGQLHPVFYWSKKTSEQEAQKHSYILEVKAAHLALKKFRHFLLGIPFKLVTDCIAFKQTAGKKDVPREVAQWILHLQDFNYTIEHRAGEKLKHVDSLSRYPHKIYIVASEISARLKKAQEDDEHIRAVVEILKSRPYENYKMKGGILYKAVNGHDVLVVPKLMEIEIIKDAHNDGHFAKQKIMHAIQQRFWIPHLENKIDRVIANCVKCIIHNKKTGKKEGFLNCIYKGDVPLHTVHIDHLGPMDATTKQYKYIFAVIDGFTKFVWLYPTKSTGCEEVLKKLREWVNVFGNPVRLVSDRGSAFTANAFGDFIKDSNIEHVLTTTGVARGNGQVERVNRTILAIVAKLSSDDSSKWYKFVPQVQAAINSHVHCATKMSPFELMFGVKMNKNASDNILKSLEHEIAINFDSERRKAREDAKIQIQHAQKVYKENYDRRRKDEAGYREGDLVAIKRTQFVAGKKLAAEYIGPYTITKVKRNGRYEVKKAATGEGPNQTSTSCDNLKLWRYVENNGELLSSGSEDEL